MLLLDIIVRNAIVKYLELVAWKTKNIPMRGELLLILEKKWVVLLLLFMKSINMLYITLILSAALR